MSASTLSTATLRHLAESISALPPLPATAQEILTCFGDEFIDADRVAAVVEGDPGICARLLGLANSAYFGLAEPVTNMSEAISRVLGVDTVRSLVLAMAIQQSFNFRKCPEFDADRFWRQSLLTAECCKRLALSDETASDSDRNLAYSAGLCHNLGLLALVHMEPEGAGAALAAHKLNPLSGGLGMSLRASFEFDHRSMTAELTSFWSLPAPLVDAYRWYAGAEGSSENRLGQLVSASAAAVGNTLVSEEFHGKLDNCAAEIDLVPEELMEAASLSERQLNRVKSLSSNMTG